MSANRSPLDRLESSKRLQHRAQWALNPKLQGPESILERAEFVSSLAWGSHGGRFANPWIERCLRDAEFPQDVPGGAPALAGGTLHVVTEAYAVGGHTRLVRRWCELAPDDDHSIVLVRQRGSWQKDWLVPAGRSVSVLDLLGMGYRSRLDRLRVLKVLMQQADRVVLHIHPDDAISVAAAHRAQHSDLRFLNHADHVSWVGAGLPMHVLHLRPAGRRLASARRGVAESAGSILPIPLTRPARIDKGAARMELGFGAHETVLLTVASGYKFGPVGDRSLQGLFQALLQRPHIKLVAIGPDKGHPVFAPLTEAFPGRVILPGVIQHPETFRAAADVYLDSYPFCSPTSMFESALVGTPIVAFQPGFEALEVLYSECPGLRPNDYAAVDPLGFQEVFERAAYDGVFRDEVMARMDLGFKPYLVEGWRQSLAENLSTCHLQEDWQGENLEPQSLNLDVILAGLGVDPLKRPNLKRWCALGWTGPFTPMMERVRSLLL